MPCLIFSDATRLEKLMTHLHLHLRLRMSGAIPTLSHMPLCCAYGQLYVYSTRSQNMICQWFMHLLLVHSWSTSRLMLWPSNWKHSSSHISWNIVLTSFLSQTVLPPYSPALFFPVSSRCRIPLFHSLIPRPFSWTCILTCLSHIYFFYSEDAGTRFPITSIFSTSLQDVTSHKEYSCMMAEWVSRYSL